MAVPNQALAPVRQLHLPHGGQERLGFRLDRLCQQSAGTVAQDGRERVVNRVRLTEGNNADTGGEFGSLAGLAALGGYQPGV